MFVGVKRYKTGFRNEGVILLRYTTHPSPSFPFFRRFNFFLLRKSSAKPTWQLIPIYIPRSYNFDLLHTISRDIAWTNSDLVQLPLSGFASQTSL